MSELDNKTLKCFASVIRSLLFVLCSLSALAQSGPIPPEFIYVCPPSSPSRKPCVTYHVSVQTKPIASKEILLGQANRFTKIITLYRQPDNFIFAATLLHECMHAVLYETHIIHQDADDSERMYAHDFIYRIEPGLTRLIQDNPALISFINAARNPSGKRVDDRE